MNEPGASLIGVNEGSSAAPGAAVPSATMSPNSVLVRGRAATSSSSSTKTAGEFVGRDAVEGSVAALLDPAVTVPPLALLAPARGPAASRILLATSHPSSVRAYLFRGRPRSYTSSFCTSVFMEFHAV